jgi:arginine deiminase
VDSEVGTLRQAVVHRPGTELSRLTLMGARREQCDDDNNVLAVSPGVVFAHERNTTTNRFPTDEGIRIVPVVGSELGRGGPRWMTCPIERGTVDDEGGS